MTTSSQNKQLINTITELLFFVKEGKEYIDARNVLNNALFHYKREVYIAKNFFVVAMNSLTYSAMSLLIKLYDKHKDSVSIRKIINTCLSTNVLTFGSSSSKIKYNDIYKLVSDFQDYIESNDMILENLLIRRDKYYMHNDPKYFYDVSSLVKDAPFTFDDISNLFSKAQLICNALYEYFVGEPWDSTKCLRNGILFDHDRDFNGINRLLELVKISTN